MGEYREQPRKEISRRTLFALGGAVVAGAVAERLGFLDSVLSKLEKITYSSEQKRLAKLLKEPPEERVVRNLVVGEAGANLRRKPVAEESSSPVIKKLKDGEKIELAIEFEGSSPITPGEKSTWYGFEWKGTPVYSD